nr:hypothetical protein CFP56_33729 [Quercus suber]
MLFEGRRRFCFAEWVHQDVERIARSEKYDNHRADRMLLALRLSGVLVPNCGLPFGPASHFAHVSSFSQQQPDLHPPPTTFQLTIIQTTTQQTTTSTMVSNERFIFRCMEHSNGFVLIITPSNKKFSRLKAKFNTEGKEADDASNATPTSETGKEKTASKKPTPAKKGSTKKRKLATTEVNDDEEEDGQVSAVKDEPNEEESA